MSLLFDTSSDSAVLLTGNTNNHNCTKNRSATATASVSNGKHSGTDSTMHLNDSTTTDATSDRILNNTSLLTGLEMSSSKETTSHHNEHLNADSKVDKTDDDLQHLQQVTPDDVKTNQTSLTELLTVTLHLSSASTITDPDNNTHYNSSTERSLHLQQRTDLVRVILIPISGLQQREAEMIQTARALHIPITRWNGSLLYTLYQQQKLENVITDATGESRRINLHLYQDSDMKWSTTNDNSINKNSNGKTAAATTAGLSSSSSSIWFGTCLHKNIDLDWIQSYYVTGRISIPSSARGYDVLWLLEYFQLMYQPDQFHFANYATHSRVQLWSKYYCYLRPKLIDWIIHEINRQQKQHQLQQSQQGDDHHATIFPLLFGTMSSNETSMELGTERLLALGDVTVPISITSKVGSGSSKRTLADRALKLFNTSHVESSSINHATNHHQQRKHHSDEGQSQTTVPCPEELTATEIRNDFCRFLKYRLREHDTSDKQNLNWNVQFTVRPVTVNCTFEDQTHPEDMMNSNSSNSSTPVTNGSAVHSESAGTNKSMKNNKITHQRYMVVHRAVLVIDARPRQLSEIELITQSQQQHRVPSIKLCRTKSDLSAPVDELVEEEIAKGRLEELLQQVKSRGNNVNDKRDRRVTINETLSFEKDKSERTNDESNSFDASFPPTAINSQKSLDILDLNVPDDELNASLDNGNNSFNASIGVFPMAAMKKKKKPKPVFVLPDKLLDVENTDSPQLARMQLPIVKSSPIIGSKPTDGLALPGPITIVRKGTFDNTVTSALTGPFYVDENGKLRDVFENCDPESDEDFEGDEDTRAQARRHEWIQTALLNRGIGERMETLLKEEREPNTTATTTSFDPWDWITGVNVCELSREVLKSVEQYANCVLCEGSSTADQKSSTNDLAAETNMYHVVYPLLSEDKAAVDPAIPTQSTTNETILVKDNGRNTQRDEQSREDKHFEHIVENIVFTSELDSRQGSFGSQNSKDSPRLVQRFDSASSADKVSAEPIDNERTDIPALQSGRAELAAAKFHEKKNRGIKGLFRRKRVDSTSTGTSPK